MEEMGEILSKLVKTSQIVAVFLLQVNSDGVICTNHPWARSSPGLLRLEEIEIYNGGSAEITCTNGEWSAPVPVFPPTGTSDWACN